MLTERGEHLLLDTLCLPFNLGPTSYLGCYTQVHRSTAQKRWYRCSLVRRTTAKPAARTPEMADRNTAATVLVVEDQVLIRNSAVQIVEDQGYLALQAGSGDEAMSVLRAHPEIDVLFTDVVMAGSLDGLGLAANTHTSYPKIAIVVTSGTADRTSQLPEGATFICKPYAPDDLAAIFQRCIDQRRPFVLSDAPKG